MPSCSQMRLQLLHFHAIFKMWPTFQELTSIVSLRRRCLSQRFLSENRNIQGNQSNILSKVLSKMQGLRINIFLASRRWHCHPRLLKVPNNNAVTRTCKKSFANDQSIEIVTRKMLNLRICKMQLLHFSGNCSK